MMENFSTEPELNGSPPRRVRRRGTHGFGTLFSQFFCFPIILMALMAPLWCLDLVMVRVSGPIVPCQIVDRHRQRDSHDEVRYYLKYRATINGQERIQQRVVGHQIYEATPIGTLTKLQVSPWFPGFDPVLLLPGQSAWEEVWLGAFTSLIMLAGAEMLVWFIYILPTRNRKIVVWGVPVMGRVCEKGKTGVRTPLYFVNYEYSPLPSGAQTAEPPRLRGQQRVSAKEWETPQVGDSDWVLYDPKKPEQSVLYHYCDYKAVA